VASRAVTTLREPPWTYLSRFKHLLGRCPRSGVHAGARLKRPEEVDRQIEHKTQYSRRSATRRKTSLPLRSSVW
jgi:hypothetical protein